MDRYVDEKDPPLKTKGWGTRPDSERSSTRAMCRVFLRAEMVPRGVRCDGIADRRRLSADLGSEAEIRD